MHHSNGFGWVLRYESSPLVMRIKESHEAQLMFKGIALSWEREQESSSLKS